MFRTSRRLVPIALAGACVLVSGCAARQVRVSNDFGIPQCAEAAARDLLSPEALQCWFTAPHGLWRTLNHQSHLAALVVEVEARDLRDAQVIAQLLVNDPMTQEFAEILVYVGRSLGGDSRIRRVQWTRGGGYEAFEFSSPAADTPLTVRSRPDEVTEAQLTKP